MFSYNDLRVIGTLKVRTLVCFEKKNTNSEKQTRGRLFVLSPSGEEERKGETERESDKERERASERETGGERETKRERDKERERERKQKREKERE